MQRPQHTLPCQIHAIRRRVARGFTLIEMMIVIALIAILASIAVPSYTGYMRRGQMPEAFSMMLDWRIKMEQSYQDNRNYGVGGCARQGGVTPQWAIFPASRKYFDFTCEVTNNGQNYVITATGARGLVVGYNYTVNQADQRLTTKFKNVTASKDCWVTKDLSSCD